MSILNRGEISLVKGMMREAGWDAVMKYVAHKIDAWNSQEITGTDAFQTLRALHHTQGKVEGVKEIFEDLEKKAFD